MIRKLLNRLNRVFCKEPGHIAIATITSDFPMAMAIEKLRIHITTTTTTNTIDISSITVSEAITAIDAMDGISATLLDASYAGKLARGILGISSQTVAEAATLYYSTSATWQEMQAYAWALEDQNSNIDQAEQCAQMHSASGEWLDTWLRDYCGVYRTEGESDDAYRTRAIIEITAIKANNLSMSKLVKDALGIDVQFLDASLHLDEIPIEQQSLAKCRFLLDMAIPNELNTAESEALIDKIKAIASTYRAAGTYFMIVPLRKLITNTDTATTVETMLVTATHSYNDALINGPIYVGAGHVVGAPGLLVGINNPMLEQVVVKTINASDDTVAAVAVYGG